MKRNNKYTPFYSFRRYMKMKKSGLVKMVENNIGEKIEVLNHGMFEVFREIHILDDGGHKKDGNAIFQVIFHAPNMGVEKVIKRTDYTIPFFAGLLGFCNKKFMVNKGEKTFSGLYEWEDANDAKCYAESFAVKFMSRRSKPYPLHYKITDKSSGEVIKEGEV